MTDSPQRDPALLAELRSRIESDPVPGLELEGEPTVDWETSGGGGETPTLTWGSPPHTIQLSLGSFDYVFVREVDHDRLRVGHFDAVRRELVWDIDRQLKAEGD
jgi:hypothetical protein